MMEKTTATPSQIFAFMTGLHILTGRRLEAEAGLMSLTAWVTFGSSKREWN